MTDNVGVLITKSLNTCDKIILNLLVTSYKQWNLTLLSNKSNKNLFHFIKKNKKDLDFIQITKKQKDNKVIFFSQNPSKIEQHTYKNNYNILFNLIKISILLKKYKLTKVKHLFSLFYSQIIDYKLIEKILSNNVTNLSDLLLTYQNIYLDNSRQKIVYSHKYFREQIITENKNKDLYQINLKLFNHINNILKKENNAIVSIVLLCYNHWKITKRCLKSILKNTKNVNYEIIVVNNNSSDKTVEGLNEYQNNPKITVVHNDKNYGFAKGMNIGSIYASGEYIIFLNNDTYCYKNWLKPLINHMKENKDIGILTPTTSYSSNESCIWISHKNHEDYYEKVMLKINKVKDWVEEVGWKETFKAILYCGIVRKSEFYKIGLFDINFGRGGWDDDDLSYRYKLLNLKCAYTLRSIVYHIGSFTLKKDYSQEHNLKYYQNKWNVKWKATSRNKNIVYC